MKYRIKILKVVNPMTTARLEIGCTFVTEPISIGKDWIKVKLPDGHHTKTLFSHEAEWNQVCQNCDTPLVIIKGAGVCPKEFPEYVKKHQNESTT